MRITYDRSAIDKVKADVVAALIPQDKKSFTTLTRRLNETFDKRLQPLLETDDFRGKEATTAIIYLGRGYGSTRLLLVGVGETKKLTAERYRRAAALAAKRAKELRASSLALQLPDGEGLNEQAVQSIAEGSCLALYRYDKYITKKEDDEKRVESVVLLGSGSKSSRLVPKVLPVVTATCEATFTARDLANAPGNEIYPESLAKIALESARRNGYKATVFDETKIRELGMGGVLAVAQGSIRPPRFITLEYGAASKKCVVLIGKGVTFDSGGISIKPAANMSEMKMDMSGAAAVVGAFEAVSRLRLPVHVVGLIPAVENMPSGSSMKPGDIVRHYGGKTSEVDNTDAEGRLILADALAYAEKFKPAAVIDLATLTGACVVALGHVASGMMGNDDRLMKLLKEAGEKTYERVWRLPMFDEYEKLIKSEVADVKNVGGRWAGAITAAWFLKKFVADYPWVHLDIAGTAILEEAQDYTPKGGSGVGVRLLFEFLRSWR